LFFAVVIIIITTAVVVAAAVVAVCHLQTCEHKINITLSIGIQNSKQNFN
jgi:hypothetical protein